MEKSKEIINSAIDIAKEVIDDSTKEVVNEKIKNIINGIDENTAIKSSLIGLGIGLIASIIAYKIFNKNS